MTDTLIRTKLRLPFIRPGLVVRLRLQEQVTQGLRGPLTVITAPAGFGKTTLVASYIAGCGMPVAWLSLDKYELIETYCWTMWRKFTIAKAMK